MVNPGYLATRYSQHSKPLHITGKQISVAVLVSGHLAVRVDPTLWLHIQDVDALMMHTVGGELLHWKICSIYDIRVQIFLAFLQIPSM